VSRARARVLILGVGGLGCPAALALARTGIEVLGICDDDVVEATNLHRQILFGDGDVGAPKVDAAVRELRRRAPDVNVRAHPTRLLPANAMEIVRQYDVVVEGSDNFATKFLAADACMFAGVGIVHASAVRWIGTVLGVGPRGRPCYRCLFEDLPTDGAANCAEAGVMGPVLGVIAAAQVDWALSWLDGDAISGQLVTFDGQTDVLRRRTIKPRIDCALCGAAPRIRRIDPAAYDPRPCVG
jgi:molybdopterin/thiamine biosynthesis adenylyltransferase